MSLFKKKNKDLPIGQVSDVSSSEASIQRKPTPSIVDKVAGEASLFKADLVPYLPQEIVGGSVPAVSGSEEESVWNAASQATGTERVNYVYTIAEGRCWYIATPVSALASNPDSWCPLAAALPGNSEYWDKETVYIYEQEGLASALRWEPETGRMQVFVGASRTLLPRVQSMDANFVTIDPKIADIAPWRNRRLLTEKLSRATARALLYAGLLMITALSIVLTVQYIMTNTVKRDLVKIRRETDKVSTDLMVKAYGALQSDTIKHMVRIQSLLDHLENVDGTLVRYQVKGDRMEWEALVPQSFTGCNTGPMRGCKVQPGLEKDGRVRVKGVR